MSIPRRKSVDTWNNRAKSMIQELSAINYEIAQMTISADEGKVLPDWFMVEVARDLPRLAS